MVGRIEYGPGRSGGEALFVPRRRPASKLHGANRPTPCTVFWAVRPAALIELRRSPGSGVLLTSCV